MKISQLRLTCKKCNHVFEGEIVTNAPLAVFVASCKAVRCPKCGDRKGLVIRKERR